MVDYPYDDEIVDHLLWPIPKRLRGANGGGQELAVVAPPPPPPLPPPPPPRQVPNVVSGMELLLIASNNLLPPKKRKPVQTQTQFGCHLCGRDFNSPRALGAHKGHHARKTRRRAEEAAVVADPAAPAVVRHHQKEICPGCGKGFVGRRGLGGHKRHCRGAAAPPRMVDRSRAPAEAVGGAALALPW